MAAPGELAAPPRALPGVLRSVDETPDVELHVRGAIPPYVRGALLRNGPGAFELRHSDDRVTPLRHWFDGVSMLHRFQIDGAAGRVRYCSRFTAEPILRAARSVDKKHYNDSVVFGVQDPCKGIFGRLMAVFRGDIKDPQKGSLYNVGVTVENVPGLGLLSRTDGPTAFRFNPDDIEVAEFLNWTALELNVPARQAKDGHETGEKDPPSSRPSRKEHPLRGHLSAAHGQLDQDTGEYFNFTYEFGNSLHSVDYKVFRVGPSGHTDVLASIPYHPVYLHSLALTSKYVILILYPLILNPIRILLNRSLTGAMHFEKSKPTRFFVISREEGRVVADFSTDVFWCFHTVNAFDDPDEDKVHIDLVHYDDDKVIQDLYVDNLRTKNADFFSRATLYRYTLAGITSGGSDLRAEYKQISPETLELPTTSPRAHLKDYRYVYGTAAGTPLPDASAALLSRVAKFDVRTGEVKGWMDGVLHCSEAIFVADPDGVDEDDGCLLVVCYDAVAEKSFLAVLDAKSMTEVARAYTPTPVPAGFHGNFV